MLLWAVGLTVGGYFLGQIDFVKNNVEAAVILIVIVSLIPVIIEFVKHRQASHT